MLEAAGVGSPVLSSLARYAGAGGGGRIGYPVVLKVAGVAHKSDWTSVALDLTGEAA